MEKGDVGVSKTKRFVWSVLAEVLLAATAFLSCFFFAADIFAAGYTVAAAFCLFSLLMGAFSAALLAAVNLTSRRLTWAIGACVGFAAAAVVGFSPMMIPMYVAVLGGSELLYHLYLRKTSRLPLVASLSVFLALVLGAVLVLHVLARFGSFDFSALVRFVQERAGEYAARTLEMVNAFATASELEIALPVEQYAGVFATTLVLSLPGIFCACVFFIGYVASYLLRLATKVSGTLSLVYPDGFYPAPTIVTCIVYAVCLLFGTLFSGVFPTALLSAVSTLQTVLELLFLFVGLSVMFRPKQKGGVRRKRTGLIFGLLILLVFSLPVGGTFSWAALLYGAIALLGVAVPVLSYVGLFSAVFAYVRERREHHSDSQKGI